MGFWDKSDNAKTRKKAILENNRFHQDALDRLIENAFDEGYHSGKLDALDEARATVNSANTEEPKTEAEKKDRWL